MDCGHCKDCKHWLEQYRNVGDETIEATGEWRWCGRFCSDENRIYHPDNAYISLNTNYGAAWLHTRADFGCVQWEAKE